jgi:hypothetical protein
MDVGVDCDGDGDDACGNNDGDVVIGVAIGMLRMAR